jgi:restriction system protein
MASRAVSWRNLKILGGTLYEFARHTQGNQLHQAIIQKAETEIEKHLDVLVREREKLVTQDAYGTKLIGKWRKEIEYFITHYIKPVLTEREQFGFVESLQSKIADMIDRRVEEERVNNYPFRPFSYNMTPFGFEIFCAEQLRCAGWIARVTKQSRDQGADVIAEKDGIRVVLQCKLYSRSVGNKAVQEVVAAKGHEQAHYGIVVSNQPFTEDAQHLAFTNKIILIHHTDLSKLSDIVCRESTPYYDDVKEFLKRAEALRKSRNGENGENGDAG